MPRNCGRSSLMTVSLIRLRPSDRRVSRWFCFVPIFDRVWVIFRRAMVSAPRLGAGAQEGGRGHVLQREPAARGDLFGAHEALQRSHRRVDDVDRVVRAERLAQHVVDARALQHGTHRAAGDDAGAGGGGLEQDDARGALAGDRVRDGALDAGDLEEVLLGLLDALGDRVPDFLRLAVADADGAVAVADDHQGGEAEAPATADDLGHPVDGDDALDVRALLHRGLVVAAVATLAAVVPAALAALGVLTAQAASAALRSSPQRPLPFLSLLTAFRRITAPPPLPGPRRPPRP